jgi:succinate-acetate transporter protein
MGIMCFVYLICSIRTNIAFVIIFFTLVVAFGCLAGTYWQVANGNAMLAGKLQIAAGAFLFVTCASGWWIFFAIMLAALDFPFQIPGM